ncbi:homoserine O-acetyltransferase [Pilimelia terevasa]|uniref:Homoserine O-acetyltransferase n=1 Tax=Pilimelia terevasa TaxID=53372 RepID=A0A8J3BG64_9ACTN|nr:homoserine O-succinyltransferase [Pilimelia terevasa]GGK12675.1 homoserine O-acetyltransferase [Pilimelia terevasa]
MEAPSAPRVDDRAARSSARRTALVADLDLRHAGRRTVTLRAEVQGRPGAPVVVVAGGISADRHAAASPVYPEKGWWDAQIGPGRPLDPDTHQILAMDWLGADGRLDGPVDSADQADALALVCDHLGVARLAAFVGSSYGAMTGLQFAARHGDRLDRLVAISGADRPHPYASALRAVQRQIVALGQRGGQPDAGLALARQLAMLTYRTPEEFAARFADPVAVVDGRARAASADYLEHCGARYAGRTTPEAFRCLSESIDLHRVDAAAVRTPTFLVAVVEDQLVPATLVADLARRLAGPVRYTAISSLTGHDAFLTEPDRIGAVLRAAFTGGPA